MTTRPMSQMIQHLRKAAQAGAGHGLTDEQLLERFLQGRDEAAFEAMVRRHGGMVLGVCRRVLRNEADTEDAFQATFLVFLRKAEAIRPRAQVGPWLYGVAYRTALKARSLERKRRWKESRVPAMSIAAEHDDPWDELQPLLDREISRLPEKYRVPVVLCELEGKSRKDAARQLGWPEGTLSSRLAAARKLLARRLRRHGPTVTSAALGTLLAHHAASAGVPASLVSQTVRAGAIWQGTATTAAAGVLSARVAALTQGVLKAMLLQRIKQLTLIVIGFATLAGLALALLPELVAGPDASAAKSFVARTAAQAADEKKPAGPGRIHFYRQGRLQSMTPDGKDPQWHSDEKPGEEGLPTHARLSPDGKRIAYGTRPRREPGEDQGLRRIFIRGVDEQGPGEELPVQGVGWCWSPDSTRLAIITGEPGKTILNVIVELKTKKVTELKLAGFHFVTDWTPDGQWLLATRMQEKPTPLAQLCLVNVHSFEVKELTGAERYCFDGRMSPDGNKVLFSSTEKLGPDARRFVWMMHLKEKKPRQVTFEQNGDLQGYCWAPDSERFAYVWRQRHADRTQVLIDTESFLVVSDLEGKNPVTLVTEKANQAYIISLAWLDWR